MAWSAWRLSFDEEKVKTHQDARLKQHRRRGQFNENCKKVLIDHSLPH